MNYSSGSPVLSSLVSSGEPSSHSHQHSTSHLSQCLKFKYFATFLISTCCLALLSASLTTHKWIVSKPIRILRLNGGITNVTSLMLTAQSLDYPDQRSYRSSRNGPSAALLSTLNGLASTSSANTQPAEDLTSSSPFSSSSFKGFSGQNNKFQGEIYFGLFNGVKVLNHGFGDRISQISVLPQTSGAKENSNGNISSQQELVNFKFWLVTLVGVLVAVTFALIGSIFAMINFVVTPKGTLTGPVGLVVWNAISCFSCLAAIVSWLVEYFARLQANVLTAEEVQNGWTSENRSQFGYSYYLVVLAFVLHLVNIFIVSLVQFETWTSNKMTKRQLRAASACEGVIMLY